MFSLILGAIFLPVISAHPPLMSRIVGGHDAHVAQFPHQVSIFLDGEHNCGGAVLNEEWILSAAHCFAGQDIGDMFIYAGITNLNEKTDHRQMSEIDDVFMHPNFEWGDIPGPYDIALVKLAKKLDLTTPFVKTIDLPEPGVIPIGPAILSGWGSTSNTLTPNFPDQLQTIEFPIITFEECEEAFGVGESPLAETNICTGPVGGSVSHCVGDSGGPLIQDKTVVGIVSWTYTPCGAEGLPSVYTQVSLFIDFIHDTIKKH